MAKGDLYRLAVDIRQYMLQNPAKFRQEIVDKEIHEFTVSLSDLQTSVAKELKSKEDFTPELKQYIKDLIEGFSNNNIRARVEFLNQSYSGFRVRLYPTESSKNMFALINRVKLPAQQKLIKSLNDKLGSQFNSDKFLDSGHSFGVAKDLVARAITPLVLSRNKSAEAGRMASALVGILNIRVSSRYLNTRKEFVVRIEEEGHRSQNTPKSNKEAETLRRSRAYLESWLKNHDWLNQKGSDSYKEFVINSVLNEASKSKHFKGPKVKTNTSPASTNVTHAKKSRVIKHSGDVSVEGGQSIKKSSIDIISLLNAKLPEEVRKRMTYPRLVNRTGRFASSVRAVAETRTPSGALSIAYTYQRSPYQVFERTLGRAPWNTPEREPRDLINESIRAIAASVMTERFFTRRV